MNGRAWLGFVAGVVAGAVGTALYYRMTLLPWATEFAFLLTAGGLGGLAQSLSVGGDRLRLPRKVDASEVEPASGFVSATGWDAGFLSDLLIGTLGAAAGLLFGLALLNDRFFAETAADGGRLAIPAWARIVAFGVLAGYASRQLLPALSAKLSGTLADQLRDEMAAGARELNNQVVQADMRAERALASARATRTTPATADLLEAVASTTAASRTVESPRWVDEIGELIERYDGRLSDDQSERVRTRMNLAEAMQAVVVRDGITTTDLFGQIRTDSSPSWLLPLATLIAIQPGDGDAGRLLDAYTRRFDDPSVRENYKFVLYRVLLAISALHEAKQVGNLADRARGVAEDCRKINEASLRKRADAVLAMLRD